LTGKIEGRIRGCLGSESTHRQKCCRCTDQVLCATEAIERKGDARGVVKGLPCDVVKGLGSESQKEECYVKISQIA
jgi:hypothetical protein